MFQRHAAPQGSENFEAGEARHNYVEHKIEEARIQLGKCGFTDLGHVTRAAECTTPPGSTAD
jgi:hypothetical protein